MKSSTKSTTLLYLGMAGALLGSVFQHPLGLPDWAAFVLLGSGSVLLWYGVGLMRRAKAQGDPSIVPPTPQQFEKRLRLILAIELVGCLSSPFWLPYTGLVLPFYLRVVCSLVGCATFVAVALISARAFRPKE